MCMSGSIFEVYVMIFVKVFDVIFCIHGCLANDLTEAEDAVFEHDNISYSGRAFHYSTIRL